MNAAPPTTSAKPRRRWYQFSLRMLLVAIVVLGIGFTWLGFKLQRRLEQRRAIKAIEAAGATVMYELPHSFFARSEWLCSILGDEMLLDVSAVGVTSEFGDEQMVLLGGLVQLKGLCLSDTQVTDDGLKHLRGLAQFTTLDLGHTQVTDKGLMHLRGLPQLHNLHLDGTRVTDVGLAELHGLMQLEVLTLAVTQVTDHGLEQLRELAQIKHLDLGGTKVTDVGLKHLQGLTQLQVLRLDSTQVTDAGVVEIRKALPNLKISR